MKYLKTKISKGQLIGYAGASGTAVSPHLHLDLRVGTSCSLEYQLNNPTKSCASYGFDPHMHPYLMLNNTLGSVPTVVKNVGADIHYYIQLPLYDAGMNKFVVKIRDLNSVL